MRERQFKLDYRKAPGLVGLWGPGSPGGKLLYDMSGYGNNGTLTTMDPATDWVFDPDRGWVLDFDGSNDYVAVAAAGLAPKPMSFSCWFTANGTPANYDSIAGNKNSGWSDGWHVYYSSGSVELRFTIEGWATNVANKAYTPTAAWTHLAVTWDATTMRIYVNAAAGTTDTYTGAIVDMSDLRIGSSNGGSARNWPGKIADARLYNRALSAGEVSHIYRATLQEPYGDLRLRPDRAFRAPAVVGFTSQKALVIGGGILGI